MLLAIVLVQERHDTNGQRTMKRQGFTLIELLIVVVVIGILASIAVPQFSRVRDKAFLASMKSDLKNYVTAQESYYADYLTYGTSTNLLASGEFSNSTNVNLVGAVATSTGWSATATHANLGASPICGVYAGNAAAPNAALSADGEVGCW